MKPTTSSSASRIPTALVALTAFAWACASPSTQRRDALAGYHQQPSYMHAGFSAGPSVFTDESGHLAEERRYEPFAAPIDARYAAPTGYLVGAPDVIARDLNPLNKRTDPDTGWSDHGARWMAPQTARWLTPDPPIEGPAAAAMGAPWRLNPYQYVDQNPVVYWDPDGRTPAVLAAPWAPAAAPVVTPFAAGAVIVGGLFSIPFLVMRIAPAGAGSLDSPCGAVETPGCDDQVMEAGIREAHREAEHAQARAKAAADAKANADRIAKIAESAERRRTEDVLYRGVPNTSPGYELAVIGVAEPIDPEGHDDPFQHNEGNTNSVFTSWTRDPSVAVRFATDKGKTNGIVLKAYIPRSQQVVSPDNHEEAEVLVRGPVRGAQPKHVTYDKYHGE